MPRVRGGVRQRRRVKKAPLHRARHPMEPIPTATASSSAATAARNRTFSSVVRLSGMFGRLRAWGATDDDTSAATARGHAQAFDWKPARLDALRLGGPGGRTHGPRAARRSHWRKSAPRLAKAQRRPRGASGGWRKGVTLGLAQAARLLRPARAT